MNALSEQVRRDEELVRTALVSAFAGPTDPGVVARGEAAVRAAAAGLGLGGVGGAAASVTAPLPFTPGASDAPVTAPLPLPFTPGASGAAVTAPLPLPGAGAPGGAGPASVRANSRWFSGRRWVASGVAAVALLSASGAAAATSSSAVPGDVLYPVKRLFEQAETVVRLPSQRATLQASLAQRRLDEIAALLQAGAPAGMIESVFADFTRYRQDAVTGENPVGGDELAALDARAAALRDLQAQIGVPAQATSPPPAPSPTASAAAPPPLPSPQASPAVPAAPPPVGGVEDRRSDEASERESESESESEDATASPDDDESATPAFGASEFESEDDDDTSEDRSGNDDRSGRSDDGDPRGRDGGDAQRRSDD